MGVRKVGKVTPIQWRACVTFQKATDKPAGKWDYVSKFSFISLLFHSYFKSTVIVLGSQFIVHIS